MFDQLKKEIVDFGLANDRDADIFMRLHGLDGQSPESLRKTAARHGLSAERIRQIADRIAEEVSVFFSSPDKSDALRKSLAQFAVAIAELAPGTDESVTKSLVEAGMLLPDGRMASSIVRIADIVARNPGLRIDDWGGKDAIVGLGAPRCFQNLITLARKIAAASGAVAIRALTDVFAGKKSIYLGPKDVRAMVSSCAEYLCAHGDDEWFHFEDLGNDAVVRASNRVGSLGQCSLHQLAAIDSRVTRSGYGTGLPEPVMAELLSANGFLVAGDMVSKANGVSERLSAIQMKMVEVMRSLGGTARQMDYIKACVAAGINSSTARVYLYRSGLFACTQGHCSIAT